MKANLFILSALAAITLFSSCDPAPPAPTQEEVVTALLTGDGSAKTWTVQSVKVDGVDKSSLFSGMTIKFTEGTFTVTNGGPLWPGSGSWSFTNDQAVTIERNDGTEIDVSVTETSLTLTMPWNKTTFGPGRTKSVSGQHVFTFN